MTASRMTTIALLCAVLAVTAACGRKSNLDTPYQAAVNARKQAQDDKKPVPPEPKKPVRERHFFLDPLI